MNLTAVGGLSFKNQGDTTMSFLTSHIRAAGLAALAALILAGGALAQDVVRPAEIKSKRLVIYSQETYVELADLWQQYYNAYPSEYAYANWMYAARYAGDDQYSSLLEKGLKKYPANPTLLYLTSLQKHGAYDVARERKFLEEAVRLDPNYMDPWFSLVIVYMTEGDRERMNVALRTLLENGAIADEVMDYNYNVLVGLQPNAILITNGDNDTYPSWILTRILGVRPDVTIVNRSLLNTEWYPMQMIEAGLPRFIREDQLAALREQTPKVGDTLITMLVESAELADRPVYFASTVYITPPLKPLAEQGRLTGLATLVTPAGQRLGDQVRQAVTTWLEDFRTAGLNSWRLRNAPETDAGRLLAQNYASVVGQALPDVKKYVPDMRDDLFNWYIDNVEPVVSENYKHGVAQAWACYASDIAAIDEWCKKQGIACPASQTQ
jgi:hypothetical protein